MTSYSRRRITTQLLLLLAVFQHSEGHAATTRNLRRSKSSPREKERPKAHKVPPSSGVEEQDLHHPRDLQLLDAVPELRVVGGNQVTNYSKHPYFAEWHNQFCGGALVHDDLVLTAAHCDNAGKIANNIYFKTIERAQQGSVIRGIAAHVTHPKFNAQYSTRDYDYMLLKLDSSALVDDLGQPTGVQIIDINTNPAIPGVNDPLWGIGYGQVGENVAGMSPVLKDATIYAFANQTCEAQYQQYFEQDYMFCSGVQGGGTDTCQGDSGGPIVDQNTGLLVGLVSFGIGCARPNYAGVNARVSAASDWILRSICEWSNYPKCNGSYAPTPAPSTSSNNNQGMTGNGNGNNPNAGSVTISITYDDYPEEIAWTLLDTADPTNPLEFQPWASVTTPGQSISNTYPNLQQGITYSFKVADSEGDGICCGYGTGSITIMDNIKGQELWKSRGHFGPYYEIEFDIRPNGRARMQNQGAHYRPSTWPSYEAMFAPTNEAFWPGAMPVADASAIVINVDTDDYPEELSWTLHHQSNNPNEGWVQVEKWSGKDASFRELVSTEVSGLSQGWHRFIVRDTEGDGNCCEYGSGYVSVTGPLAVLGGTKGLVWGNDGKFWGLDTVFFLVNNKGYISHISKAEATIARTIPQQP